ncbi:hypothetical protein J699_00873 [Acinetobacter sp. 1000160]|nr:hypothetical protein J699_00873 [Acinetobacter sp. 1000160]
MTNSLHLSQEKQNSTGLPQYGFYWSPNFATYNLLILNLYQMECLPY